MSDSPECFFTPTSGVGSIKVPPHSLRAICSTISDPDAESIRFSYSYEVDDCSEEEDEPEADEDEPDEDE